MKGMKRFMAAFLAAMIMVASAPMMKAEAAENKITARFVDWGRKTIRLNGEDRTIYDASECYIGVDKCNAIRFYYEVFALTSGRRISYGYRSQAADNNNRFPAYQVFKIPKTRKTVVCKARVKAKIGNNWSAFSGWILLVPPHTPEYTRIASASKNGSVSLAWSKFDGMKDYRVLMSTDGVNWTAVKRTVGNRCTVDKYKGTKLNPFREYYFKVVGRAYFNGKYLSEKGDTNVNSSGFVIAEIL